HALMRTGLHAPNGEPTFATFGFTNMLLALLRTEQPELLAVVFDSPTPTFRHEQYAEYKATRQAPPEDLAPQLEHVKQLLDALGIPRLEYPGYEADDLIATLASQAAAAGYTVFCVTSDKDFFQLLSDRIYVLRPATREGTEYDLWDTRRLLTDWGLRPDQVIDFFALVGDPVDNVPGVRGVGEKTALQLLQQFGSLEALYTHLDTVDKPSLRQRLYNGAQSALLSRHLVQLRTDAPVQFAAEDFCRHPPNAATLNQLLDHLAMKSLRERLAALVPELHQELASQPTSTPSSSTVRLISVTSETAFRQMLAHLRDAEWICIEGETTGSHVNATLAALILCPTPETVYYVPLSSVSPHPHEEQHDQPTLFEGSASPSTRPSTTQLLPRLVETLQTSPARMGGHDIKRLLLALRHYTPEPLPTIFDTMIASYVLNPDDQHALEPLLRRWLPQTPSIRFETNGELSAAASALCQSAIQTLRLCSALEAELCRHEMLRLAEEIEFPLVEVLAQMEWNGVAVDPVTLRELGIQYRHEQEQLRQRIYAEAGVEFNIDSPKQLAEVLFEKLHLPPLKKTKTGYSTDV
ncbi:MAG: DNA polymerase, partial [Candidatus Kapabacteria bacterium]|nr:DNA polymerase [Candidatus Kapabacteria bacterium]